MELLNQILSDLDKQDFSRFYYFEHSIAVTCIEYSKKGCLNYCKLLQEALDKYKASYIIWYEQQGTKAEIHDPGNS